MKSEPELKTSVSKQPLIKGLAVSLFPAVGIALILLLTRGSQFCFFSIGGCVQSTPHNPIAPIGIAATAAAVLITVVEVPVVVAVAIAIVIGLIAQSFI